MPYSVIKKESVSHTPANNLWHKGEGGEVSSGRWEYCYKLATCCYLVDKLEITIIRNKKHFIIQ